MNRTLLDRVMCILYSSGIYKHFWVETVMTTCFLVNRTPSSAIDFRTPGLESLLTMITLESSGAQLMFTKVKEN